MKYSFIALFAYLVVALLLMASPVLASIVVDEQGNIVVRQGQVLSSGSGSDGSGGDDNSGSGSSNSDDDGDEDRSGSSDSDDDDDATPGASPTPKPQQKEIAVSQVPANVIAAARNAVPGIKFTEAEVEGSGTSASYELEGFADNKEYEIKINAAGTVLKVELEDEEETRVKADEERTEVRLPGGIRVKTRIEDGKARTDVYQGGTKVRFEREGDRFRIKVEDETGGETEVGEDDILTIDERADKGQIRVRTFSTTADQARNRAIVERLNTQALTDLPLSIDLATNELTVTTPAGERVVTVLPDQAVQNMLAANVIDQVGGQELANIVRQGGIETLNQVITLAEQNGVPIYVVQGVKNHRLLGFIPVTTDVTVSMSAETGEVLETDQSVLDTIVDVFSTSA